MSDQLQKKKMPVWLKVLIAVVVVTVGFNILMILGSKLFRVFTGVAPEEALVEKGVEKLLGGALTGDGGKVDVDISEKGMVIRDEKTGETVEFKEEGMVARDEKGEVKAEVKAKEGTFVIRGEGGKEEFAVRSTEGQEARLPSDIPAFSPATVKSSVNTGNIRIVMFESGKQTGEITSFYKDKLKAEGWKEETVLQSENSFFGRFTKENRSVQVTVGPSDETEGATMFSLTFENQAGG